MNLEEIWEEELDFGEEWSVLSLGMVSEGGEYGSKSPRQVRKTNPTKGTRPPPQRTERGSERGEGDLWIQMELERGTGGQG